MTWTKQVAITCMAVALLAGCGSATHHQSAGSTTSPTTARTPKKVMTKVVRRESTRVPRHHAPRPTPPPATTTPPTTAAATTTTTAPARHLPPLSFESLPVPSGYACPSGLVFLAPADQATGQCLPYAFLVGGTASDPNHNTACPPGSTMSMGPVLCDNSSGIVTPVPPGASGPSSTLAWSAVQFPTATCVSGYYSGDTDGTATCVPSGYLLGQGSACPSGSALRIDKLTGTLCTEQTSPYDIVAPVAA